jgi:hypothetical protein
LSFAFANAVHGFYNQDAFAVHRGSSCLLALGVEYPNNYYYSQATREILRTLYGVVLRSSDGGRPARLASNVALLHDREEVART